MQQNREEAMWYHVQSQLLGIWAFGQQGRDVVPRTTPVDGHEGNDAAGQWLTWRHVQSQLLGVRGTLQQLWAPAMWSCLALGQLGSEAAER